MRKMLKQSLKSTVIISTALLLLVPYTSLAGTCYFGTGEFFDRTPDHPCWWNKSGYEYRNFDVACPNGWQIGVPVTNISSYVHAGGSGTWTGLFARSMQSCGGGNDHAEDLNGLNTWGISVSQFVPTSCKQMLYCYYRNQPSGWCDNPANWKPGDARELDLLVTGNCVYSVSGQAQNPIPAITVVNGRSFSITLYNSNGFSTANTSYGNISVSSSGGNQVLTGTLNSVPGSFVDVNLGSGKIKLKAIQPPKASAARVSFY